MNRTIKYLMISDIFFLTGFGLINPILAIFFKENIIGGTIFTAGLAITLYLITKSIVQLPFSRYVDSHKNKLKFLLIGTFLTCLVPFLYIYAKHIYWIFFAQIFWGAAEGIAYPTWLGLWSTHLDKKHESFEWSLYSTSTGIGVAIAGALGAAMAQYLGFKVTFLITGCVAFLGFITLFGLEKKYGKKSMITLFHHKKRKSKTKHHLH